MKFTQVVAFVAFLPSVWCVVHDAKATILNDTVALDGGNIIVTPESVGKVKVVYDVKFKADKLANKYDVRLYQKNVTACSGLDVAHEHDEIVKEFEPSKVELSGNKIMSGMASDLYGRIVALVKTDDKTVGACAKLEEVVPDYKPDTGPDAEAIFTSNELPGHGSGRISFKQLTDKVKITYKFEKGSFNYSDTDMRELDWHIHVNEVGVDCAATGGHYDPLNAKDNTIKATGKYEPPADSPDHHYEMGDLSGKHAKIKVKEDGSVEEISYEDMIVALGGDNKITGRSVVLHDKSGDRIACANIKLIKRPTAPSTPVPRGEHAHALFDSTSLPGEGHGRILFKQEGSKVKISYEFEGGFDGGNEKMKELLWHIHEKKVNGAGDCASTGGHYDPHGAKAAQYWYPPPANSPQHHYEMGDLSGKHGKIIVKADGSVESKSFVDAIVALGGIHKITGRSVVLHDKDGKRIACATIKLTNANGGGDGYNGGNGGDGYNGRGGDDDNYDGGEDGGYDDGRGGYKKDTAGRYGRDDDYKGDGGKKYSGDIYNTDITSNAPSIKFYGVTFTIFLFATQLL